jgi:hypothetical protein
MHPTPTTIEHLHGESAERKFIVSRQHATSIICVMVSNRTGLQKVDTLTERVLAGLVDTSAPTARERDRRWTEHGRRALGICQPVKFGKMIAGESIAGESIAGESIAGEKS